MKKKKKSLGGVGVCVEARYLTVRESSAFTGATVWAVRNWAWERRVPFIKIGHRLLFDKADLLAFMESQKVKLA